MPSMGGSATLISAPHLGDLLDVDMSAKVDKSIPSWLAGPAKYEPLPGVRGSLASGLAIDGDLGVGDSTGATEQFHHIYGSIALQAGQAIADDGFDAVTADLNATLNFNLTNSALVVQRSVTRGAHTISAPLLELKNLDAAFARIAANPGDRIIGYKGAAGTYVLLTNYAGAIGCFGVVPPTVQPAITGALSTVADAPAKAVLTSIIAALVGCGLASDGTT